MKLIKINAACLLLLVGGCSYNKEREYKKYVQENNKANALNNNSGVYNTVKETVLGCTVQDIYGEKFTIKQICKNKPKLILKYSNLSCNVCVDSAITNFMRFTLKNGVENSVLLVNKVDPSYLARFLRVNDVRLKYIYSIKNDCGIGASELPHFFIINEYSAQKDIFFPNRDSSALTNAYFIYIEDKYFKTGR
jgi:hypothetical protein